jgi:hypothetical protein
MAELLRNRRVVCRRTDRFTVHRCHPPRRHAHRTQCGAGWRRVCDADHHSLWGRTVPGWGDKCSLAGDCSRCSSLGLLGLSGVVYSAIVARRLQRQSAYKPEFEDWLFHVLLPFAGYVTLSACALAARSRGVEALYGVAGAALLLLFTGIHNAWDAVTYHVFIQKRKQQ